MENKANNSSSRKGNDPCEMTAGEGLIQSLTSIRDSLKSGERPEERFTLRTVDLELNTLDYCADDVRCTREKLNASQAVFAKLIGVSVKTVQSWEQGVAPNTMACRIMDLINEDPERWLTILRKAVRHEHIECIEEPDTQKAPEPTKETISPDGTCSVAH